jgi:hypothetical protein
MTIVVASRRRSSASVEAAHPGATVLDVTSRGSEPWVRLSPFYPHGGIPVPLSPGRTARSVEGIWQALKVFEGADVDPTRLTVGAMRGLKRTVRANGPVRGHRAGLDGAELLPYVTARRLIYLPAHRWMLEHRASDLVARLRETAARQTVVLLDAVPINRAINGDVTDVRTPLSHAALVRAYVENDWPA